MKLHEYDGAVFANWPRLQANDNWTEEKKLDLYFFFQM